MDAITVGPLDPISLSGFVQGGPLAFGGFLPVSRNECGRTPSNAQER